MLRLDRVSSLSALRGIASLTGNQTGDSDPASPPKVQSLPLEGESQKPGRSPEPECIELVEMSKGQAAADEVGDFNTFSYACILR